VIDVEFEHGERAPVTVVPALGSLPADLSVVPGEDHLGCAQHRDEVVQRRMLVGHRILLPMF
jgi:hypothetical protein